MEQKDENNKHSAFLFRDTFHGLEARSREPFFHNNNVNTKKSQLHVILKWFDER